MNAATTPDRYSIPNLQTNHYKLAGAKVFSRLDLVKAYHFFPVKPNDVPKTAICTPFGTFEYVRMPFGLRNSANSFQRFIDSVLREFPFVTCYIDDLLIFSRYPEEHLKLVFKKLDSMGLKINANKSELFKNNVKFLGYLFSNSGIKPLPERVESLNALPSPPDSKTLQKYLGTFAFYQRCIPHFSDVVGPLRELMNSPKFSWKTEHEEAFANLKKSVCSAVELCYSNKDATFTITADASGYAIGACLNQVIDGVVSPLSFFSRKLSETEKRYSTFDRELLAAFASVRKWKDLILGSCVTLFTDHKPLVGAIKSGKPRNSDRQQRQLAFLNEFVADVVFIAGKDNVVADTLSRPISNISAEERNPIDLFGIAKAQKDAQIDFTAFKKFPLSQGTEVYCEDSRPHPRPYVPELLQKELFESLHQMSHPGIKASIKIVGSRYFWPSLKSDVKKWVEECQECQVVKINRHTHKSPSELPCPSGRFTNVHIDIVGPLSADPSSPRYFLTMVDSFTRWFEVFPLNDISAESVCKAFFIYLGLKVRSAFRINK